MSKIFKNSDVDFCNLPLTLTDKNVEKAHSFISRMRKDICDEPVLKNKYSSENSIYRTVISLYPRSVCKFTPLFTSIVFEGNITGNCNHQFITYNGGIIDLNANDDNLKSLPNAYRIDEDFISSRDYASSKKSSAPTVLIWLHKFNDELSKNLL